MSEPNNVVKVSEEDLYAAALAEVQSGTMHPGLWAKAFADSEGNENKSKALYIKLRVQQEIEHKQQEQKAADALATEPARRKAAEFTAVIDQLRHKGYKVKRTAAGWAVRESLYWHFKFDSDKTFLEYAQRHVAVAPELFEWLRTHECLPTNTHTSDPTVGEARTDSIPSKQPIAAQTRSMALTYAKRGAFGGFVLGNWQFLHNQRPFSSGFSFELIVVILTMGIVIGAGTALVCATVGGIIGYVVDRRRAIMKKGQ